MPRPLRTRKQAPAAVASAELVDADTSTTVKVTKKNKPAAAAPARANSDTEYDDSTLSTPKAKKPTRTRAAVPASSDTSAVVESRSRTRSTKASSSTVAPPVKKAPSARTRSSAAPSSQTTRATRRTIQVPATQSSILEVDEQDIRDQTPSTIIPSTPARRFAHGLEQDEPEQSPSQSSNAENRSPRTLLALTSSPPIAQSTPKGNGRALLLDFSSDAGYTPPPPSTKQRPVGSVERPRLRDLDAKTLEPVGILDGWDDNDEEDDDDTLRLPPPSQSKHAGRPSDFLIAEEEDENDDIIGVSPRAELQRPEGGIGFFVDDDSQEFMIYSDPKSKSATPLVEPAKNGAAFDDDDIMRPPESTDSSSPARKRRSSEAGIDDGGEATEVELTPRGKRPRATAPGAKKPNSKANTQKEKEQVKTNDLRSLLPRRKRTTKTKTKTKKGKQDVYDELTSEDDGADDNVEVDILTRRSGRTRKAAAATAKKTTPKKSAAKVTKPTAPLTASKKPSRTYARKSLDNSANDPISDPATNEDDEEPSTDSTESGDGIIKGEVKKQLNEIKKKFEEVDKWNLEFEEVSVKSSDSGKR
ncbi:hypothetical protein BZA05DRAFT_440834 [Tricharina praecox]|uniref:uncharacterized protein n=1 Tax=Tricharina praecox TaxID=43433 RepID=UPI00221F509A|nr:uncharacterized protein BZA05DRAFT_440834 [Tricharina praecox]KAI5857514.1 hypothetical protein BZA05DRAFT_440834 [Tricharina praecox]